MPVNAKNLVSAAEAVLFSVGEPLELSKLSEVLSVDEETCRRTLLNLSASLDERSSGICLLRLGDKYQLSSRTEYADLIRSVLEVKKNAPLSPKRGERRVMRFRAGRDCPCGRADSQCWCGADRPARSESGSEDPAPRFHNGNRWPGLREEAGPFRFARGHSLPAGHECADT